MTQHPPVHCVTFLSPYSAPASHHCLISLISGMNGFMSRCAVIRPRPASEGSALVLATRRLDSCPDGYKRLFVIA